MAAERAAIQHETVTAKLGDRLVPIRRPIVAPDADFSEASVIAAARKRTGLHFFGDDPFRENLRVLIHSMKNDARLNPFGRLMARQMLIARLADRLNAQELFDRYPEILETKLGPITVIVGAARSGTTRIHRLLCRDERFLHLRDWEVHFPVPMAESFGEGPDPRIARAKAAHAAFLAINPENAKIHAVDAESPEEEIGLLNLSFVGMMIEAQRFVPSFGAHGLKHKQTAAYAYMKKMIQLIAWFRGDDPTRPWILKSPQHMQDLDALMEVFPEARIVFIHRDPRKIVASNCSLMWNMIVMGSDEIDPGQLGEYCAEKMAAQVAKVEKERTTLVPADQQMDILYSDINADWEKEIGRIYDFAGMEFSAGARAAMQTASADRDVRDIGHKYALSDFGLDEDRIDRLFADYVRAHGVPREGAGK